MLKGLARCIPSRGYMGSGPDLLFTRNQRQNPEDAHIIADYLAYGSRNWLILGNGRLTGYKGPAIINGVTGGRQMMQAAESYASLGEYNAVGQGSVYKVLIALFFVGSGLLKYAGTSLGVSASSVLSLRLLSSGAYGGTTYQAGLASPSAADVGTQTASGGFSGTMPQGTVSVVIWRIRSSTGAPSVHSEPSAVVIVTTGNTVRVTFPAADSNGQDRWGIGVSHIGFGASGPYYLLKEVSETAVAAGTVNGVPRSVEIEWTDADLAGHPLAPIDDFPPPAAVFGGTINDTGFLDGCYGERSGGVFTSSKGSTIALSKPLFFESYPPDSLLYTPEPPTALISRPADGYAYRAGLTTLGSLMYTGGDPPISYHLLWPSTGVAAPHNLVLAEGGRLYAWTGQRGWCRISDNGEPDNSFSKAFDRDSAGFVASNVVLGWDPDHQIVSAMHGKIVLPYNSQLDLCCTPLDLTNKITGDICAAVTINDGTNNKMIIAANDGSSAIRLYNFNTGTGMVSDYVTPIIPAEGETDCITRALISGSFDNKTNPVVVDFRRNGDTAATRTKSVYPRATGQPITLPTLQPNVRNARSHALKVSVTGTGGDVSLDRIATWGDGDSVVITK